MTAPAYRFVSYRLVEGRHGKRIEIIERDPSRAASSPRGADTAGPVAAQQRDGAGLSDTED